MPTTRLYALDCLSAEQAGLHYFSLDRITSCEPSDAPLPRMLQTTFVHVYCNPASRSQFKRNNKC